jgi:hypothetical protein
MNHEWISRRALQRQTKRAQTGWADLKSFAIGGGLPAWVSAASAVCALCLAVYAYSAWKEQEGAKRKAEFAMELLRSATAARLCFNYALDGGTIAPAAFDKRAIQEIAMRGREAMRSCRHAFSKFSTDLHSAEHTLGWDTFYAAFRLNSFISGSAAKYNGILRYLQEPAGRTRTGETTEAAINRLLDELGAMRVVGKENVPLP